MCNTTVSVTCVFTTETKLESIISVFALIWQDADNHSCCIWSHNISQCTQIRRTTVIQQLTPAMETQHSLAEYMQGARWTNMSKTYVQKRHFWIHTKCQVVQLTRINKNLKSLTFKAKPVTLLMQKFEKKFNSWKKNRLQWLRPVYAQPSRHTLGSRNKVSCFARVSWWVHAHPVLQRLGSQ